MAENTGKIEENDDRTLPTATVGRDMLNVWLSGIRAYRPVLQGKPLETENGTPEVSLRNLRAVLRQGTSLQELQAGRQGILAVFKNGDMHYATGLHVGTQEIATRGIAEIAFEGGLGPVEQWRVYLHLLPVEYEGELTAPTRGARG